jgi:hypothetical protein
VDAATSRIVSRIGNPLAQMMSPRIIVVRRRVLAGSPPALERRLIAFPKA